MGAESRAEARRAKQRREEHYGLLFAARRGVRYHLSRERFLMRVHTTALLLGAITGTSAFAALVSTESTPYWAELLVGVAAFFGVFDLVAGPSRSARRHGDLARECGELEREAMRTGPKPSEEELAKLVDRRLELESREPAVRRVLDALCHDELVIAFNLPKTNLSNATPVQRLCAQFIDIFPSRLRTRGQTPG